MVTDKSRLVWGAPRRTQYSTLAGLNDGGAHVASIHAQRWHDHALYGRYCRCAHGRRHGSPRAARDITFGALQTGHSPYDGDIAEVRLYDTQLSNAEAYDLTNQLLASVF